MHCLCVALLLLVLSACASYPVNARLESVQPELLRVASQDHDRSNELQILLSFSGGGTRAAAFSYGVLEVLADTIVTWDGQQRRLLDEVDLISSVSGGSFTSAYFGLFGDRIFEDFETRFLKQNVQGQLIRRMISPLSWPKLGSLFYNRSELAADLYDELLFEHRTFGDIVARNGPEIVINATDIGLGAQFGFRSESFAAPVPRARRSGACARDRRRRWESWSGGNRTCGMTLGDLTWRH